MASVQVLRIFLSSPGDVAEERELARDAIDELQREPQFEATKLQAISWDDRRGRTPLVAQLDSQTAVERGLPKPSQCRGRHLLGADGLAPASEKVPEG
jgi:hypothetical protein